MLEIKDNKKRKIEDKEKKKIEDIKKIEDEEKRLKFRCFIAILIYLIQE